MDYTPLLHSYTISCRIIIVWSMAVLVISGCTGSVPEQKEPVVQRTELNIPIIADPVIYDVIIKNPEPDDKWAEESLHMLNREALVDIIFNAIYRNELVAYDYFSEEILTTDEVVRLEQDPEFSRDNIGRLQFVEEWYFDEENLRMEKRVNSITLGYETYDYEGNLRGYKPAFLVRLN